MNEEEMTVWKKKTTVSDGSLFFRVFPKSDSSCLYICEH